MAVVTNTVKNNTIGEIHGDAFSHNSTTILNIYPTGKSSTPRRRGYMPAKSGLFCGRATQIRQIVSFLTQPATPDSKRGRFCILGTGGMGKTSLAFEVMHDEEVKRCYSQQGLIWGPCAQALSPELLLDTLHKALDLSSASRNPLQDILDDLRSSGPVLLLLDNFETPWNSEGSRAEIARILLDIEQLPNVAVLITMRATDGPCEEIQWEEMRIESLDEQASCQLYTRIYPESKDDRELPELLNVLGHMPLAIKLMAQQGKNTGRTAAQLIKSYQKLGTGMLGPSRGSDRQNSMDISIQFSLESSLIQNEPDARRLLIRIAMLLGGTTYGALEEWWAPGFPNLDRAIQALLEASLLERRTSTFFVLPVIRSYVLGPRRFPDDLCQSMIDNACRFLKLHNSVNPGEPDYNDHTAARLAEEINLQAVLLGTTIPTTEIIEALITLTSHQYRFRARVEVIEHAIKLARQFSNKGLLGHALFCYAHILKQLGRNQEALGQLRLSREMFLSVQYRRNAAMALLEVAYLSAYIDTTTDEIPIIKKARKEFKSISDDQGVLQCLIRLAIAYSRRRNQVKSIKYLTDARALCPPGLSSNGAWSAEELAIAHHRLGQYDDAERWALTAYKERKQMGGFIDSALWILGKSHISKGNYDQAISCLTEGFEFSTARDDKFCTASILLELGRAWRKKGESDEARHSFTEASRNYSTFQGSLSRSGLTLCSFYLRRLENPELVPTPEETLALRNTFHDEDIS